MSYSIGLDLGIASVGWSIIDTNNGNIVDLGVRLFSSRNSENNKERRDARGARRLLDRRKTRLADAEKKLAASGFVKVSADKHKNPYELRVKGLSEKLSSSEINIVVKHILKKRGISYMEDADDETSAPSSEYKQSVQKNMALLAQNTPGQIQWQRLKEKGRVRTGYNQNNEYQLNVFTVSEYADELSRILQKQADYYPAIDEAFIAYFVDKHNGLVYRKRPYYEGPGNAANPSPYGRWKDYDKDGKPKVNIFDQLIGTDITGKLRASASSLSAQKYNLLNDLNNLTLTSQEDPKVSTDQKERILHYLMYEDITRFGPKDLAKLLGVKFEDIKGWRLDNKDKPEIHSLKVYRDWRKIFNTYGLELNDLSTDTIDFIAKVITLNTEREAIESTLHLEGEPLDENIEAIILDHFKELKIKASAASWHAFAPETLKQIISELLHTSDEQNTILERLNLKVDFKKHFADLKHLPVHEVVDEIYNPTVSKTVSQAFKVLNALMDRLGKENISNVVIEMPRDKNEDEQQKRIRDSQKFAAKQIKKSNDYFIKKSGWTEAQFENHLKNKKFAQKLRYYYEQDGQCAYSGEPIAPDSLLTNAVEIDHVIPLSISFDDSMKNKVLVKTKMNQAKGQQSPYGAFQSNTMLGRTWDEYKAWVKSRKYYKAKERNLLDTKNIYDPEVMQGFVQRNINDTRYASRVILNAVQSFFLGNHEVTTNKTTKVTIINGAYTSTLRKNWGEDLEKSRKTHHHHAVDATLCAVSPFVQTTPYIFRETDEGKFVVDEEIGEMIPYHEFKKKDIYGRRNYRVEWPEFREQLKPTTLHPRIKFSHQVDKKWNRRVANATIYSTRNKQEVSIKRGKEVVKEDTYIIGKIKNIYTEDGWKAFDKQKDKLLMKENDPQTYAILMDIATHYPDFIEKEDANGKVKRFAASPFKIYCDENGIPGIRKYAKKDNGPIIRSVKFYDQRLKSHINITKNEDNMLINETSNGKKAVLLSLNPWRTDVYYDEKKQQFLLMGIKYIHLRFKNGKYGIPKDTYNQLKQEEKIPEHAEFKFSLYRKDRIRIELQGKKIELLFNSKLNGNSFETKPIEKANWEENQEINFFGKVDKNSRFRKAIKKDMKLIKLNTDYLGNTYPVYSEPLLNILDENA